ncbi:MAG: DUF4230 domain-containing protein [Desulfonatronovibrionaceae bacterium]
MSKFDPRKITLRQAIRYTAFILIVIVLFAVGPRLYSVTKSLFAWRQVQDQALQVLQREELLFLVTDRVVTQVVVESHESSLLLGSREGYLVAKAKLYYGVDLSKLSKDRISREGTRMVITIPEPEELDFTVEIDSIRYLTKRSRLQTLKDWALDRDQEAELRSQFKEATYSYLREEDLIPERARIVTRLNEFSDLVSDRLDVEVVFR